MIIELTSDWSNFIFLFFGHLIGQIIFIASDWLVNKAHYLDYILLIPNKRKIIYWYRYGLIQSILKFFFDFW